MNPPPNHSPPPELQQFKTELQFLLKPCNPRFHSLTYFIRRSLWQFNLQTVCTENEIIHEAYLRGTKLTAKGVAIHRPDAWLRKTALNIVRELSRKTRRCPSIAMDGLSDTQRDKMLEKAISADREEGAIGAAVIEEDLETVRMAMRDLMQELPEIDRAILWLSIVEGYSWKQVSEYLTVLIGEPGQTEVALRKRKQRILERLRKLYHQQTLPI